MGEESVKRCPGHLLHGVDHLVEGAGGLGLLVRGEVGGDLPEASLGWGEVPSTPRGATWNWACWVTQALPPSTMAPHSFTSLSSRDSSSSSDSSFWPSCCRNLGKVDRWVVGWYPVLKVRTHRLGDRMVEYRVSS